MDEVNIPASKRRRIMSSSSESFDTDLSDTESEDDEEVSVGHISEEWVPHNDERLPFPFTAQPGKTFNTPPKKVPVFCLKKFLDADLIKKITKPTNLYAAHFFANNPNLKPRSRLRKWKDTDESEIKIFLGLLILEGILGKPSLELY